MSTLATIVFAVACLWLLGRVIGSARGNSWAGPRTPAMRTRAAAPRAKGPGIERRALRAAGASGKSLGAVALHPGNRAVRTQARADAWREWQGVFATDWLEQQRHDREHGTTVPGEVVGGGTATATRPTMAQRLRLKPSTPPPASPASGGSANGNGQQPPVPPPANGSGGPPARPVPPPAPTQPVSSNGGTLVDGPGKSYKNGDFGRTVPGTTGGTVATGTSTASGAAGAEQFIDGVNQIHATAASGGINAKQAGIKSATEGCLRFAAMLQMLARQMSETGRYGPEITEPLAKAATHLQAGATNLGESDTAITTLKHMQVGELAMSARQAPHHAELNEAGAR